MIGNQMKLCIIDTIGLAFDGKTLSDRGLGGSESAVILMAKELSKIGFDVTVFNDCESDGCFPGSYDFVKYLPLRQIENHYDFDIAIGVRSVAAFVPEYLKGQLKNSNRFPNFENLQKHATYKVLWMHDTFCDGDHLVEECLNRGLIDQIFTLSDFHTSYITNCDHGAKRNFEVLKNKIFQTRNGVVKYKDQNGDGIIDTRDRTVIGNALPKWYGGITNTFNYKGIDFSFMLQFNYGNDIYNATRLYATQTNTQRRNQPELRCNRHSQQF
jgi:hypothetical protein